MLFSVTNDYQLAFIRCGLDLWLELKGLGFLITCHSTTNASYPPLMSMLSICYLLLNIHFFRKSVFHHHAVLSNGLINGLILTVVILWIHLSEKSSKHRIFNFIRPLKFLEKFDCLADNSK